MGRQLSTLQVMIHNTQRVNALLSCPCCLAESADGHQPSVGYQQDRKANFSLLKSQGFFSYREGQHIFSIRQQGLLISSFQQRLNSGADEVKCSQRQLWAAIETNRLEGPIQQLHKRDNSKCIFDSGVWCIRAILTFNNVSKISKMLSIC